MTGFSQGYPTISQREAETAATVRDGDSFVIGGLTQDENITNKSKVPLLGDIPIIGQAFRTDKSTLSKTELYIVVTPHVVRHMAPHTVATNGPVYAPTTMTTLNPGSAAEQPADVARRIQNYLHHRMGRRRLQPKGARHSRAAEAPA